MTEPIFSKTIAFYDQCLDGKTDFQGIDLAETTLDNLLLHQVCNFDQASFVKASLVNAHIPGCSMMGVNFENAVITDGVLNKGNYLNASFKGAVLKNSNFSESNLQQANFSGADLTGCDLSQADLRGALLADAVLVNTNCTDALYDIHTRLPMGLDPTTLGMKVAEAFVESKLNTNEVNPQSSKQQKKTKEIVYRGQRMVVEVEEPQAPETEETSTFKEIWYRGQKTIVEKKAAPQKPAKKPGLKYRGAS